MTNGHYYFIFDWRLVSNSESIKALVTDNCSSIRNFPWCNLADGLRHAFLLAWSNVVDFYLPCDVLSVLPCIVCKWNVSLIKISDCGIIPVSVETGISLQEILTS